MKKIHTGFLLSFDYEKLKKSIPPVYKDSDRLFIAIDKDFLTWSGNKFDVNDSFFEWLKEFDKDNKIELYYDAFYVKGLTGIQMDTRERHMLSKKMGIGNWLIQVDSDEYILNFKDFVESLKKLNHFLDNPEEDPIQVSGYHIDVYKYLDDGILYVENMCKFLLATNYPNYKLARQTRERIIYVNTIALHESLSRSEEELEYKLNNWSHREDINSDFLTKWKKADKHNFKDIKDVFYLNPKQWETINYAATKDFTEITKYFEANPKMKISRGYIIRKNLGQWFKHLGLFKSKKKTYFEPYF